MSSNSPAKAAFTGTVKVPSPKRENGYSVGPATQLIIKDVGEIHSRLLDHRPIIQGETRYFIKEFEEKRGHREMRVLENVKNSLSETSDHVLPRCTDVMRDQFGLALKSLEAANLTIHRLQQREQENEKSKTAAQLRHENFRSLWEAFMKEQEQRRLAIDEEHNKAVLRLKEQYAEMDSELSKMATF
ncbi:biogenesis of lysosome-related organelles complex 1 subunit 5 [Bufo gargarizans]|uniref:biogenesis of lysosome-related organelles complex 1 subunit 5 n=1 Tax=Bufo gargarizans TaxID=30331 RepID=UPI001CF2362C|nr:biogenesis of lysosome-related organelles complex 1 subunit 5 [Bufo gargarizans]